MEQHQASARGGVIGVAPFLVLDIIEPMFYNGNIATGNVWILGGLNLGEDIEDYKQKIIELIQKCNNIHWIKTIYAYVKTLFN